MTSAWASPFTVAVVGGLTIFVVLLIPTLVVQYQRFGRLSPRRVLGVSAVCVYGVAVLAYTLLPLPEDVHTCVGGSGAGRQLVPFAFVADIARRTSGLGPAALTSPVVTQVVFNVALFVPLGLLVRRLAGRGTGTTVLVGFLVSLAVEVTQGTALWGIYDCPYRVADVDDLITNTAGALLGALAAPRVLGWLPQAGHLTPLRRRPTRVTAGRRWLGMFLDLSAFAAVTAVVAVAASATGALLQPGPASNGGPAWVPPLVAGVLVCAVPALSGSGASWGQRLVWLTPSWPSPATRARRLLRAGVVGGTWTASAVLGAAVDPEGPLQLVALVLGLPALASPFVALRTRRGLSGVVSGARILDARTG